MDGALKPNDALDLAEELVREYEPDNLVCLGDAVCFSTGNRICRLDMAAVASARCLHEFPSSVTCLAAFGEQLAVGLEAGQIIILGGPHNGLTIDRVGERLTKAPVAACFENGHTLLLSLGSQIHSPAGWKRDLMEGGTTGSIWRIDLASGQARLLRDHMAFPYGIAVTSKGVILVSESWRHRVIDISKSGSAVVIDDLPFYPARLSTTLAGKVLVCGFAPRRQLVEFILSEDQFLRRMLSEVPEQYWMAPALNSGTDCWEPLQGGQIRQHGVMKPWAPTRSYGLVATMDVAGRFVASFHCRAGGIRHGTTSAIENGSRIVVASKGGDVIVAVPTGEV
jgi:hypothetical protein